MTSASQSSTSPTTASSETGLRDFPLDMTFGGWVARGRESLGARRPEAQVTERDRAVVALQQQRPLRLLRPAQGRRRRLLYLDVLVDDDAVVDHLDEPGVRRLLAGG